MYSRLKEGSEDLSYNGSIMRDIFSYASWFAGFDCCFVPRICNQVADTLANLAFSGGSKAWIEDPPKEIVSLLLVDSQGWVNHMPYPK